MLLFKFKNLIMIYQLILENAYFNVLKFRTTNNI